MDRVQIKPSQKKKEKIPIKMQQITISGFNRALLSAHRVSDGDCKELGERRRGKQALILGCHAHLQYFLKGQLVHEPQLATVVTSQNLEMFGHARRVPFASLDFEPTLKMQEI